jgi:putative ABC transport system permease protein
MGAWDYILTALQSILLNKVRAFLTTLGVIIGVMSVVMLIALGESAQAYVEREFAIMGSNMLIVTPGKQETIGLFPIVGATQRKLTLEQARAVKRKAVSVTGVAANQFGLAQLKYRNRQRHCMVLGTTPDFEEVRRIYTRVGRFITEQDIIKNNKVCVIGSTIKRELFGNDRALYQKISINGTKHLIVGILEDRGMALGIDLGDICIIPVSSAFQLFTGGEDELIEILVGVRSREDIPRATESVRRILYSAHDNNEDFTITDQDDMLGTFNRIFDMLRLMLVGIASISLLVGGIGIMNIMLVSVRERTQEVGIRKAVGATRRDITVQFLIEAITLSAIGGLIGLVLAAVGTFLLGAFYPSLPIGVSTWSALTAFGVSVAVGVFFGVYPAVKAAGVDPVVALRYE